ncbi:MAG: FAD-dependent thymidylate synthase, partial [bacterium]|nr:FAD-dependent thymidylate synthase [bacterium]
MAPQNSGNSAFISPPPRVSVVEGPQKVVALAYAAAKTCYSEELVFPDEGASAEAMTSLAGDTYRAGHHTLWQHANFVFALDGVSRLLVWSLLHSFPWYDSSQRSQRYVPVRSEDVVVPAFRGQSLDLYQQTVALMMAGYQKLVEMLSPLVVAELSQRFPKGRKGMEHLVTQKAQEVARYVLPLGTTTGLYYTINATTLMCLRHLCHRAGLPVEGVILVGRMVSAVLERDPLFGKVLERPLESVWTYEFELRQRFCPPDSYLMLQKFTQEFDASLGSAPTQLVSGDPQAESTLATAVRGVLGLASGWLGDEKAISVVLDPAQNPYLSLPLDLACHSPAMRPLTQVHWTFRERLSNTGDSQWQRHRTAPTSRPLTWVYVRPDPDYVT